MAEKDARRLRYPGPFKAVAVPALGKSVERNHQIVVDDPALAEALLAQGWEEVGAKAAAKKQDETPPADQG